MAHEPNTKLAALFPELRELNDDYRGTFGSVRQAIAYSPVFWPEFTEYEGCLLCKRECDPANFEVWMDRFGGDRTNVEGMLNHVHITDYFLNAEEESTPEQVEYLGKLLQQIWTLKLQHDFPLLDVRVEFYWHDRENLVDAQITVYCQRKESA